MDEREKRQTIDFADSQAELAGVSTGRQERFLTGSASRRNGPGETDKQTAERRFWSLLDQLLADPAYAAAHARANDLADTTQTRLTMLSDRAAARIEHLEDLADTLDQDTAHLPDGRAVYRDQHGQIVTADGRVLSPAEAGQMDDPSKLLPFERRKAVQDALNKARERQTRLSELQDRLDDARHRLNDPANPPGSVEDIDAIEEDIEDVMDRMDALDAVAPTFAASASHDSEEVLPDLAIPDMKTDF